MRSPEGAKLGEWMKEEGLSGTPSDLERLAEAGDATAKRLYDFAVGHLALAIANQVTVLNPGVLVLGGGVLSRGPGMVQRIRDTVARRSTVASSAAVKVLMASLGDDSPESSRGPVAGKSREDRSGRTGDPHPRARSARAAVLSGTRAGVDAGRTSGLRLHLSRPMPFQVGGDVRGTREVIDFTMAAETVDLIDWT